MRDERPARPPRRMARTDGVAGRRAPAGGGGRRLALLVVASRCAGTDDVGGRRVQRTAQVQVADLGPDATRAAAAASARSCVSDARRDWSKCCRSTAASTATRPLRWRCTIPRARSRSHVALRPRRPAGAATASSIVARLERAARAAGGAWRLQGRWRGPAGGLPASGARARVTAWLPCRHACASSLRRARCSAADACFHCGEPLPASPARVRVDGGDARFCCDGCAAAAQWIRDARLDDYYRLRSAAGRRVAADDDRPGAVGSRRRPGRARARASPAAARLILLTEGMRCAACAWLIDRALAREPGVLEVSANAVTGRIRLAWDPARTRAVAPLRAPAALGYRPYLADRRSARARAPRANATAGCCAWASRGWARCRR